MIYKILGATRSRRICNRYNGVESLIDTVIIKICEILMDIIERKKYRKAQKNLEKFTKQQEKLAAEIDELIKQVKK